MTNKMTKNSTDDKQNAELWLRARHGLTAEPRPEPDEADLLLAGYLDGSLDDASRDRAEAWLASDAEALDRLIALRADLAAPRPTAPAALIGRAQGLVRAPVQAAPKSGFWAGLAGLFQPMAMATAAAVLVACVIGFQIGRSGYESVAAEPLPEGDLGFGIDAGSDDLL